MTACYGVDVDAATRYPTFDALLAAVRAGQHTGFVTGPVEALGLDLAELVALLEELAGLNVTATVDGFELTSSEARRLLAGLARAEAAARSRRAKSSHVIARARGKRSGRPAGTTFPRKLVPEVVATIHRMRSEGVSVAVIAKTVGCSKVTIYQMLQRERA